MSKTTKTIVEQVKALLFSSEEQNFSEVKTTDGVILNISEVVAGGTISVVDAEGSNPAPAGEYVLEDGSTVVVTEDGIISEIKPVEVDEESDEEMATDEDAEKKAKEDAEKLAAEKKAKEEMSTDVPEAEVNPLEGRVNELEGQLADVLARFSKVQETFSAVNILQAEELVSLESKFEAFKASPAEEKVVIKKSAKGDKLSALGSLRRNK